MSETSSPAAETSPNNLEGMAPAGCGAVMTVLGLSFAVAALYRLGPRRVLEIQADGQLAGLIVASKILAVELAVIACAFLIVRALRPTLAKVFVSYPHEQANIAGALFSTLNRSDISAEMIPFIDRPDQHDDVIEEALNAIRRADVVVAITPARDPSATVVPRFFEAEILAASYARKPVILIGTSGRFRVPATAYRGYPVLDVDKLQHQWFLPLAILIRHAVGTKRAVMEESSNVLVYTIGLTFIAFFLMGAIGWVLITILTVPTVALLTWFTDVGEALRIMSIVRGASFPVLLGISALVSFGSVVQGWIKRARIQRVFRDDFANRRMSNDRVRELFTAIDKKSVPACLLTEATGTAAMHGDEAS